MSPPPFVRFDKDIPVELRLANVYGKKVLAFKKLIFIAMNSLKNSYSFEKIYVVVSD